MTSHVVQNVIVGAGGKVEVTDPRLPVGARAEVVIRVDTPQSRADRLAAFRALQTAMNLTKEDSDRWVAEVAAERTASQRPER